MWTNGLGIVLEKYPLLGFKRLGTLRRGIIMIMTIVRVVRGVRVMAYTYVCMICTGAENRLV